MKNIALILAIATLSALSPLTAQTRYAGGDVSLLPEYINAGAKYYDHKGKLITDFLPWCREQGMNAMRVRLFVNPDKYRELHASDTNDDTRYDPNACQDLEYIIPLCRDIVDAGLKLMLDFHYSDTWADPVKQWTPIDWEGLTDEQLYDKIYEYTRDVLLTLKDNGITPSFIQTGNEISYGMLWGPLGTSSPKKTYVNSSANWSRLGNLLNRAIEACHEVCPDAEIVIHTERVAKPDVMTKFYQKLDQLGVDYDIIGLSYYPFWHGDMTQLNTALTALEDNFPSKQVMIVETGYALKWQVPYPNILDHTSIWPISNSGQAKFATDLVDTLLAHPDVDGLFWWWMEYNPYKTTLTGWYNAPLFDPTTGRASSAFEIICSFATSGSGIEGILAPGAGGRPVRWFDLQGRPATSDTRGLVIGTDGTKVINR